MPEQEFPRDEEEIRVGMYTCYCGGNISNVVDCEKVAQAVGHMDNVVVSRTQMAMCSDAGQSMIEEDIKEHGVNRVVIGACAPALHEQTFRGTVARAGLNPFFYNHVCLREQNSWVHHNDPLSATEKAVRLMTIGLSKARHLKPLEPIRIEAEKHALVIGGGLSGLRSAYDIAQRGLKVSLIEKTPFLGGRMAQLTSVFPTGEDACEALNTLIDKVTVHPNITIYTLAELTSLSGYIGSYQVQIRQHSRGVSDVNADALMAACTQEVPDEFNYGQTQRKVIYRAYPGCYPSSPAVDWEHYDGAPIQIDESNITLKKEEKSFDLAVGAIVVATGFDPYEPRRGEYGYEELPEVVTLPQFIRRMALTGPGNDLDWNGRKVGEIAMVHCVGSRHIAGVHEPQPDGQVNNYCSRVCCTATLHAANEIKERFPKVNIYDFYEDIRTYGYGHEKYYRDASNNMVRFMRFHGDELPEVVQAPSGDTHPVLVKAKDYLTNGEEIEVAVDLVILAVGFMPRDVDDLIQMMKISPGTDRFLLEVHPKLRPVETPVLGIVLAGTAQGPMNIQESSAAASAAAAKVAILLAKGQVDLEPFVAEINLDKCDGTGACVEVCEYEGAIALKTFVVDGKEVQRAAVIPANCSGCGNCVSACPNRAVDVAGWELEQYEAMVAAIALEVAL